jgi:hypothetical protein
VSLFLRPLWRDLISNLQQLGVDGEPHWQGLVKDVARPDAEVDGPLHGGRIDEIRVRQHWANVTLPVPTSDTEKPALEGTLG